MLQPQMTPVSHPLTTDTFSASRAAMVNSQLNPSGIVAEPILHAYLSVPRELYVPASLRSVCYLDDDVAFGNGRYLIQPLVHARMVEAAAIHPLDRVLDIGGVTGYSAAILSYLSSHVIVLEEDAAALRSAQDIWDKTGVAGVKGVCGPHEKGCPSEEPYDVILLNGAVASVSDVLLHQLSPRGRLVCVEVSGERRVAASSGDKGVGRIVTYTRTQSGQVVRTIVGDATVPYLPGFEPSSDFEF